MVTKFKKESISKIKVTSDIFLIRGILLENPEIFKHWTVVRSLSDILQSLCKKVPGFLGDAPS